MKKLLGALAALSAAGTACAQSSVTIYGTVDAAVAYYRGEGVGSRTQLVSGGNTQSKLGFRGREDLGSGTYASFELEAGFGADSGVGQATNVNNQAVTGPANSPVPAAAMQKSTAGASGDRCATRTRAVVEDAGSTSAAQPVTTNTNEPRPSDVQTFIEILS